MFYFLKVLVLSENTYKLSKAKSPVFCELIWPSGKALGSDKQKDFDSVPFQLSSQSLQKLWSVWTYICPSQH